MRPAVLQLSPKVDQNLFAFHAAQQQQQQQQQFQQQSQLQQQQQQQYPHAVSRLHRESLNATSPTTSLSPANPAAPGAADIPFDANSHATGFRTSDEVNHAGRFAPPPNSIPLPSSLPLPDYSLRRKTPNGTLAAGYDGSPDEGKGAIQPPAPKQIRISNTDGSLTRAIGSHRELGQSGPVATGPSQPREYRQGADMHVRNYLAQGAPIGQDHNMASRQGGIEIPVPSDYQSISQAQLQAQNQLYGQQFGTFRAPSSVNSGAHSQLQAINQPHAFSLQGQHATATGSNGWPYPSYQSSVSIPIANNSGQLSNVYQFNGNIPLLQQMQQQQPQLLQQQPQHPIIPTVLPYVFQQPSPGPTAPAGVGPYGPYWPDGAFIPYRPAAFRDARFLSHIANSNAHGAGIAPNGLPAAGHHLAPLHSIQSHQQGGLGFLHHQGGPAARPIDRAGELANSSDLLGGSNPAADAGVTGNLNPPFQSDRNTAFAGSNMLQQAQGTPSSTLNEWTQPFLQPQPTLRHQHRSIQQHLGQQHHEARVQQLWQQYCASQTQTPHVNAMLDQKFQPLQQHHSANSATAPWEAGGNLTLPFHTKIQHTSPNPHAPRYLHQIQGQGLNTLQRVQQPSDLLSVPWQQQASQQQQQQQQQQQLKHSQNPVTVPGMLPMDALPSRTTSAAAAAAATAMSIPSYAQAANLEDYKENVLTWAHGVYIELLAYIHYTSKRRDIVNIGGVDVNLNTGAASKPKPSIYPRPPRQLSANHVKATYAQQSQASGMPVTKSGGRIIADVQNNANLPPASSASSISSPMTPSSAASASQLLGLGQASLSSPVSNAKTALGLLSTLCVESNWNWIDGALLGGCLAYGLEEYNKACRWYTRILRKDSKHVEALSNLAATFLALDKKEEALELWKQVIKLRPSYFEAVDHLIGLLCSNGRARQAVEVINYVENSLRIKTDVKESDCPGDKKDGPQTSGNDPNKSAASADGDVSALNMKRDGDSDNSPQKSSNSNKEKPNPDAPYPADQPGFGSSGFAIPGADNGRMLALIHAKGNMLYSLGQNFEAAAAFEEAVLVGAGRACKGGVKGLIKKIVAAFLAETQGRRASTPSVDQIDTSTQIILLYPSRALQTARLVFPDNGAVPGFQYIPEGLAKKAAISTMSNSLLSLSKIYQDSMATPAPQSAKASSARATTVGDILALYYLSLSLQPSPSTANNVGILLASIQQGANTKLLRSANETVMPENLISGVVPNSSIALALSYYYYGLNLDSKHAHLYTNLGSLLKDIGHLAHAIRMYEQAVQCEPNFDIALANLANALKDSGRVNDSIVYYKRAVQANPDFAEAVCGLANSLNSVCNWVGRGGIATTHGVKDRWHVDDRGMLVDGRELGADSGWIKRVIDIVEKQLKEGRSWGCGLLKSIGIDQNPTLALAQLGIRIMSTDDGKDAVFDMKKATELAVLLQKWSGHSWEGARVVRLIERAIRYIGWRWYQDKYILKKDYPTTKYARPRLPAALSPPNAPTVLPFHTFTTPLSAKQIRHISQRNGLRISCSTLQAPWLPEMVYRPPAPPNPCLNVGYVSSDFNNHPLAHLMQSVFGLHNPSRVKAFCYATTPSDGTDHRKQIEREAPVFRDASSWSTDKLVQQIVNDGIHILVNLNGYTRGARNEVFAARPAPIHMSFMGFAGTLGAEWCDYILSDELSIPLEALSRSQRNLSLEEQVTEPDHSEDQDDWIYDERIVYTRHSFFCCDHKQSAPDCQERNVTFEAELDRRWKMRKEMFPNLSDDFIILGNFNQLYKIEPTVFRTWLRILAAVPNAILWLLRFPEPGEKNLRQSALAWAGEDVASRIFFTDVAPKRLHISRARICDVFIDTPECNAHTTAADILWSGTPLITYPRYAYKMCSRMASSILSSAFPVSKEGREAASQLIVSSDEEYEARAIELCRELRYTRPAKPSGRLADFRKLLFTNRFQAPLFDTRRWVEDLEEAYVAVWNKWEKGEEEDMWLPRGVEATA